MESISNGQGCINKFINECEAQEFCRGVIYSVFVSTSDYAALKLFLGFISCPSKLQKLIESRSNDNKIDYGHNQFYNYHLNHSIAYCVDKPNRTMRLLS